MPRPIPFPKPPPAPQAVHYLLVCLLNREVHLVSVELLCAGGAPEAAAVDLGPEVTHRFDESPTRAPRPVHTLRDAIHLHKSLRTLTKTHSQPIQWWLASYLAFVATWTFTLYFVNHELAMSTWRKLITYMPLWCMNMFFFLVPILFASVYPPMAHPTSRTGRCGGDLRRVDSA